MKTLRTIGTVAVTGTILALLPVGSASADTTDATFELTSGALSVDGSAGPVTLTTGAGATGVAAREVSGTLGTVTVTDGRGGIAGWTLQASSSTFTSVDNTTVSTGVTYTAPASPSTTGTVTATGQGTVNVAAAATVVEGTSVSGNNTAAFDPTLAVALPAGALAGTYTGTVTTSFL